MVSKISKSPKDRVVGPFPNGRTPWLINGGDPNHLQVLGWSSKYRVSENISKNSQTAELPPHDDLTNSTIFQGWTKSHQSLDKSKKKKHIR